MRTCGRRLTTGTFSTVCDSNYQCSDCYLQDVAPDAFRSHQASEVADIRAQLEAARAELNDVKQVVFDAGWHHADIGHDGEPITVAEDVEVGIDIMRYKEVQLDAARDLIREMRDGIRRLTRSAHIEDEAEFWRAFWAAKELANKANAFLGEKRERENR